jgi:phosphatidyl-myo-inositol dimannoside synthase
MRVLALLTDGFGAPGGIAQYNRDWLNAIDQLPALTALTALVRNGNSGSYGRHIQQRRWPSRVSYALAAVHALFVLRPQLIFCGHMNMAPLAALLARFGRSRFILQTHGIDAWSRPSALKRWAVRQSAMVLAVSRYTRAQVLQWSQLDPPRVRVLPNTVTPVAVDAVAVQRWRERLGVAQNGKLLLSVGRMDARERYKGHDQTLAACSELNGLDWHYAIVGGGDDVARLQSVTAQLGLGARVHFLGHLSDTDRNALLAAADVFVMPSSGEGFGIVYLEALMQGTPVIGCDAGGAPDPLSASCHAHAPALTDLAATLNGVLRTDKPQLNEVSGDVLRRFGRSVFDHNAGLLIAHALTQHD